MKIFYFNINSLSANPTKWPNTVKQFVWNLPTNCLSVFDHFVGLALKWLTFTDGMKKEMLRVSYRSSHHRYSIKKVFLKISPNSQENTCVSVSFLIKLQAFTCNLIKKETLTEMFSCEFCVIFKGTFFTEHLRVTVSGRMCSDNTSTNNCPQLLTRFVPLTFFSNSKNIRKPDLWFSVFSEGIEIDKW